MKLVEIKDVRVGQVWENPTTEKIHTVDSLSHLTDIHKITTSQKRDKYLSENCRLIGKLNITHKIEDNKLVEIPRDEVQIDDVFQFWTEKLQVVDENLLQHLKRCELKQDGWHKIGVYGVSHEFVNDLEMGYE